MAKLFPYGHATHPMWAMATGLVIAQLKAQMALPEYAAKPSLGLVYLTDHYASHAQELLSHLRQELPGVNDWAGTVGVGIAANNVEYFDEPALSVMLLDLPREHYRLFSGVQPVNPKAFPTHAALVHADGQTPDLADLLAELSELTDSGYLFGGLASSRSATPQLAATPSTAASQGALHGGLSGIAFGAQVHLHSRVTQGCEPITLPDGKKAKPLRVSKSEGHVVLEIDGEPALDLLLDALGVSLSQPQQASQKLRTTLVGLTSGSADTQAQSQGRFGEEVRVRHLVGLDPLRRGIAIADLVPEGTQLTFCARNTEAARRDLMRICAELREELEPAEELETPGQTRFNSIESIASYALQSAVSPGPSGSRTEPKTIRGALYFSCAGRGGPHFGGDSAELQLVRHALGDVPLIGFFAGGEIAHRHLYGYTGVLTIFTD
jgi:small ligand-binding sensory domain FIST